MLDLALFRGPSWQSCRVPDSMPPRPRLTHPMHYLVALLIAFSGLSVSNAIYASAWNPVREANPIPIGGPIETGGKSVAIYTDLEEEGRDIRCQWWPTGKKKSQTTQIKPIDFELEVESDESTWHFIAVVGDPTKSIGVSCAPTDGRSDNAVYGYSLFSGTARVNIGLAVTVVSSLFGVGYAAVVWWRRRQVKSGKMGT